MCRRGIRRGAGVVAAVDRLPECDEVGQPEAVADLDHLAARDNDLAPGGEGLGLMGERPGEDGQLVRREGVQPRRDRHRQAGQVDRVAAGGQVPGVHDEREYERLYRRFVQPLASWVESWRPHVPEGELSLRLSLLETAISRI